MKRDTSDEKCQFFPYKTEFESLEEALSIPDERVHYEKGIINLKKKKTQKWSNIF